MEEGFGFPLILEFDSNDHVITITPSDNEKDAESLSLAGFLPFSSKISPFSNPFVVLDVLKQKMYST